MASTSNMKRVKEEENEDASSFAGRCRRKVELSGIDQHILGLLCLNRMG